MLEAHRTPTRMALALVQYIDDPKRVRHEVLSEFNSAPDLRRIAAMRADFLRPGPDPICWKVQHDNYAAFMEHTNRSFVSALLAARPSIEKAA